MMPTFFDLQSHCWIAYLFFLNGLIATYCLRSWSSCFEVLTRPLEARLLSAFFLSISINFVCLAVFDLAGWGFSYMPWLLFLVSFALLVLALLCGLLKLNMLIAVSSVSLLRIGFYLIVFVVLFYNGGLIEQISDAWWHISLANKISLSSALSPEHGHLNGVSSRYYPPLWHANLALAKTVSGISVPVFWNSFTAWGAVLKVMAFYLFALSLSGHKPLALLAAALFFLLPGVGDSYMRVSAWPSHIAYTALFCLFYIVFELLDRQTEPLRATLDSWQRTLIEGKTHIAALFLLSMVIVFSHQLELLWFVLALFAYYLSLLIHQSLTTPSDRFTEENQNLFDLGGIACLAGCLILSLLMLISAFEGERKNLDLLISYLLPIAILSGLLYFQVHRCIPGVWFNKNLARLGLLFIGACILFTIDFHHVRSLFVPELAYDASRLERYAVSAVGVFGHDLVLPGWHLQLRQGLLYSGLLSIPVACLFACLAPARLSLFTASTAVVVLIFTTSPYLYQWLSDITDYHSPWRIATLLFHPIIMAALIMECIDWLRRSDSKAGSDE